MESNVLASCTNFALSKLQVNSTCMVAYIAKCKYNMVTVLTGKNACRANSKMITRIGWHYCYNSKLSHVTHDQGSVSLVQKIDLRMQQYLTMQAPQLLGESDIIIIEYHNMYSLSSQLEEREISLVSMIMN